MASRALMDEVNGWAGDDPRRWNVLLGLVQFPLYRVEDMVVGYQLRREMSSQEMLQPNSYTPRETLIDWTWNRLSYSRGLQRADTPEGKLDIAVYKVMVDLVERSVPVALVQESKTAARLRKKIEGA